MSAPDRLELLLAQSAFTGIDFVHVDAFQTTLDVYFHHADPLSTIPSLSALNASAVTIESAVPGAALPRVPVLAASFVMVGAKRVLRVSAATPGAFHDYRIHLEHPRIDRYFNDVRFSFKAACPSPFDCKPQPPACDGVPREELTIDYLARDFSSLRRALLDFAQQRAPWWAERLEADVGVMLVEAMSALGDELSYYQDRVAREAYLETATQRRSVRRHARLVDYGVFDGDAARTFLDVTLAAGQSGLLPRGAGVQAVGDDGVRTTFELGKSLGDRAEPPFAADSARNRFEPHLWDQREACLRRGATEMFLAGHQSSVLSLDDAPPGRPAGRWMLLVSDPTSDAREPVRLLLRVVEVEDSSDPLVSHPLFGSNVTRIVWEEPLPFDVELYQADAAGTLLLVSELHGNLVPASEGRTLEEHFAIESDTPIPIPVPEGTRFAVERTGPNGSITFWLSLSQTEHDNLVFLRDEGGACLPEVEVTELLPVLGSWVEARSWQVRASLVSSPTAQADERQLALEDGIYRPIFSVFRGGEPVRHVDYATTRGFSVRFGDGVIGALPARGAVFRVRYRVGRGKQGNVEARTLREFSPPIGYVDSVENPLCATGGEDPETLDAIQRGAPEAFRTQTFRAVRPEDYAEAAERLPWVQRAGAAFRWTGSWLSAFVTPDPRAEFGLSASRRHELEEQLDRFRQAGRETFVLAPLYADLDLEIEVCSEAGVDPSDVQLRALSALSGRKTPPTFFDPDNFTFGTPLDRGALEARLQSLAGVRAVGEIKIRRRGWFDWRPFSELIYPAAVNELIRVQNDPDAPEHGSVRIGGGAHD